jgi:lipopolysaccharide/colanic/teichoic acid biosynthesis glycosyltransferase
MLKRTFDVLASLIGLIALSPIILIISFLIKIESKGSIFYKQKRVGLRGVEFQIFKFRTMFVGYDKKGLLTVGDRDPRVTKVGYTLRKYKLDELPQLINIIIGEMSLVGPRPEVQKYVSLYNKEDSIVLSVKPGVTDYASIYFRNETEILKNAENPEEFYIKEIMPKKLALNKKYIIERSFIADLKIIFKTLTVIIK